MHTNDLRIGINIDGVLEHDGLPIPSARERFAWVKESGRFDYVEKNIMPGDDIMPYFDLVNEFNLPIEVCGGIFCAGKDEERMSKAIETAGRFKSNLFNCQLFVHDAEGKELTDQDVVDFFLLAMDAGAKANCLPSLEVHVDMWNEQFARVERVANVLARYNITLRLTIDHSHLLFKVGNPREQSLSGVAVDSPNDFYRQWLDYGWIAHAHARSVQLNAPDNSLTERMAGIKGRGIQYPFIEPEPNSFHSKWHSDDLLPWKAAVQELLQHMKTKPNESPHRISCEFIPYPDYGGGARYSIWDNNKACAEWLRHEWLKAE